MDPFGRQNVFPTYGTFGVPASRDWMAPMPEAIPEPMPAATPTPAPAQEPTILDRIAGPIQQVYDAASRTIRRAYYPQQSIGATNVIPMKPPAQQGAPVKGAPIVGKDITLPELVNLQRMAESSGNYQAVNRQKKGNTASGAYQYTDGAWNNYGGYARALYAPKEIQDRRFAEDIAARVEKYNGDIYRALAEHYLPSYANTPERWDKASTFKVKGKPVTTKPVRTYLKRVLRGTKYEAGIDEYIRQHQQVQ